MSANQPCKDAGDTAAVETVAALRRNAVRPEPLPQPGDRRWGLSAILRPAPSSPAVSRAASIAEQIAAVAGQHHVLYGLEDLHVTVRSLEGFRVFEPGDDVVARYIDVVAREIRSMRPLPIHFDGVAPTLSGVIALSSTGSPKLSALRERLHRDLAALAPVPGPEARRPRRRTHMSLVLFTGPLADAEATAATLADLGDVDLGVARFDRLELVRYERTEQTVRIVPLWAAQLDG
jgi:2'-5' RNA ligase